jgi:hypothetical protein
LLCCRVSSAPVSAKTTASALDQIENSLVSAFGVCFSLPVAATPATVWLPYLILDGKVVATDRLNEKTISRKGKPIGR